jgi:DNA-binding protein H-NS
MPRKSKITRIKINKAKATFTGRCPRTHPSRAPRRHQTKKIDKYRKTWSGHKGERNGTYNVK